MGWKFKIGFKTGVDKTSEVEKSPKFYLKREKDRTQKGKMESESDFPEKIQTKKITHLKREEISVKSPSGMVELQSELKGEMGVKPAKDGTFSQSPTFSNLQNGRDRNLDSASQGNSRRNFLKLVGGAFLASTTFSTALYGSGRKTLKIALSWSKTLPIMGEGAQFFAKRVEELSGGALRIKIFGAGELVPALQVFDACSRGLIDGFHSGPYYWKGKNSAFSLFTAYPFGMVADEMVGWLDFGGGMELWRELYAKYNLIPFKGGNSGNQMGGWFRKPIKSLADLKGLKMRIPGLGGDVMAKLGVKPVNIPAGEIYTALERGTIDATEWVGPALDLKMGFHQVAKYYYTGWHEPGTNLELTFNLRKFKKLSKEEQAIIEAAANETNARMLAQFQYANGVALQKLLAGNFGVKIGYFPEDINRAAQRAIEEILKQNAQQNPDFEKVYKSIQNYFNTTRKWTDIGIKWFLDTRDKDKI